MSETIDSQPSTRTDRAEPITVSYDGLTVEKTVDRHRDDVVKVGLTVTSSRESPARLHLSDELPDAVEADHVGFHPDYDPDGWHVEDRTVVYEAVVDPGSELETVYGVRVPSPDGLDQFDGRPTVAIEPVADDAASPAIPDEGDVSTDETLDGESSADDTEADPDRAASVAGEPVEADEPETPNEERSRANEPAGAISHSPSPDGSTVADAVDGTSPFATTAEPTGGPKHDGRVVSRVVDELHSRELTDAERAILREAFGLDATTSEQVRLDHVQATVDDLLAYRDALEGFIDEHGPAEAVVEEFRAGLAERAAELDALQESVDDLRDRVGALEDAHEADTARLESHLETVEDDLAEASTTLEGDLEAVRGDLSRLIKWREKLSVAAQLADVGVSSDAVTD